MKFPQVVSFPFNAPREDPPEPIAVLTETEVTPAPSGRSHACEFCACRLSASGEVLQMSARARELRTLEDQHAESERAHGATRDELTRAQQMIAELEGKIRDLETQKRKSWLTSSEIP